MRQKKSQQINQTERAYLDTLQRESWHLELIISGLALFGLVAVYRYIDTIGYLSYFQNGSYLGTYLVIMLIIVTLSGLIVFVNLIIHLLLRGLWIGAVGLRSISGDINFYQLRFTSPFQRFLRTRIRSFDHYIINLDRLCSSIFAFSFLLALILAGFVFFWVVYSLLIVSMENLEISKSKIGSVFYAIILVTYVLSGLIYLIDFVSLGRIKRVNWLRKIYYPIYRFCGFLTLARFYRPLYYNFIDDRFGRKVIWLAIPYMLLIFLLASARFNGSAFFHSQQLREIEASSARIADTDHYRNLWEADQTFSSVSIDADLVRSPVIKLTIPLLPRYNRVMETRFPELYKFHDNMISSNFIRGFYEAGIRAEFKEGGSVDYVEKYASLFTLKLNGDTLTMNDAIIFEPQQTPFPELVNYIPLDSLPTGMHRLQLDAPYFRKGSDSLLVETYNIPFYYAPDQ